MHEPDFPGHHAGQGTALAGHAARHRALAVLPFRNGGPPDDEYLADGITEELIDALSMTRGLRLRPRGLVMRFKGVEGNARDWGAELGVDAVVEGSVRRAGSAYRLTTRLIGVADGFQLWATRMDRPMNDLLVVVDELARDVASAMAEQSGVRARKAESDPLAVEIYLRARIALRDSWYSARGCARALDLVARALALCPDDPALLAGAALASARSAYWGATDVAATLRDAEQSARRALELEPRMAEPWFALALVDLYQGRVPDAVNLLTLAIRAAPQFAPAHAALGRVLLECGLVAEGSRSLALALELDPQSTTPRWDLARAHALLRDFRAFDDLLATSGQTNHDTGVRLHMWRKLAGGSESSEVVVDDEVVVEGLPALSSRAFRAIVRTGVLPADVHDSLLHAGATFTGTARSRQILHQFHAECLFATDRPEEAFAAFQRAIDNEFADLGWTDRCPALDRWRGDPRFAPLRAQVETRANRVLDAWRATPLAPGGSGSAQLPPQRIEVDAALREREVAEISESDFFKALKGRAETLRRRPAG